MRTKIKCPSCYFKYEEEIDLAKNENFCVCPRCGTSFAYIKPEENKEKTVNEPAKDEQKTAAVSKTLENTEEQLQTNKHICSQCGTAYEDTLFICPKCGAPANGFLFCPECHALVSVYAHSCPTCGCPLEGIKMNVICPDCGASYDSLRHVCPTCGCPAPGYTYCEDCNTLIPDNVAACPNCGCPVSPQQFQSMQSDVSFHSSQSAMEPEIAEKTAPVLIQPLVVQPPLPAVDEKEMAEEVFAEDEVRNQIGTDTPKNNDEADTIELKEQSDINEQKKHEEEEKPESTSQVEESAIPYNKIPSPIAEYDEEEDSTKNNKKKFKVIVFCVLGFISIVFGCFLIGKSLSHGQPAELTSDTIALNDSVATVNGNLPNWLIGNWHGKFASDKLGKFEVSVMIAVKDSVANFYTTTYNKGGKTLDRGNIVAFNQESFDVLFDNDTSPTTFPIDNVKQSLGLSKEMWLDKQ